MSYCRWHHRCAGQFAAVIVLMLNLRASLFSDNNQYDTTTTPLPSGGEAATPSPPLLLAPQQFLEEYKQQHGLQQLQQESDEELKQRRYAMAYYSCPHQAGNRLHHFINSVVLAMASNRTILWHYYSPETCRYHQEAQEAAHVWGDPKICEAANSREDCDAVLQQAGWVPGFDAIAPKVLGKVVNVSQANITIIDFWNIVHKESKPEWMQKQHLSLEDSSQPKIDHPDMHTSTQHRIIDFPAIKNNFGTGSAEDIEHRYATHTAKERHATMYSEGSDFLFGMLLKDIFRFSTNQERMDTDNAFAIVVHSRHSRQRDKGEGVHGEKQCLDQLLTGFWNGSGTEQQSTTPKCKVCLMSDRPTTIEKLTEYVHTHHKYCSVVPFEDPPSPPSSANNSNQTKDAANAGTKSSFLKEHGPRAGAGFFQELQVCQYATSAFVKKKKTAHSSTGLLKELVVYNRRMKLLQRQRQQPDNLKDEDDPNLRQCWF